MAQKVKNFLVLFTIFVILSGLGLVVGYSIGKEAAYQRSQGYGSSWTLLDSPLKFKEIVEATSKNVWAQTPDGKLYSFSFRCYGESSCNEWIETQTVPENIHSGLESPKDEGTICPSARSFKYLGNPPGNLVKCVRTLQYGMDIVPGQLVYYALTDNGKIWTWFYSNSPTLGYDVTYPVLFSCSGLLLSIAVFFIFYKRTRQMKIKSQE